MPSSISIISIASSASCNVNMFLSVSLSTTSNFIILTLSSELKIVKASVSKMLNPFKSFFVIVIFFSRFENSLSSLPITIAGGAGGAGGFIFEAKYKALPVNISTKPATTIIFFQGKENNFM